MFVPMLFRRSFSFQLLSVVRLNPDQSECLRGTIMIGSLSGPSPLPGDVLVTGATSAEKQGILICGAASADRLATFLPKCDPLSKYLDVDALLRGMALENRSRVCQERWLLVIGGDHLASTGTLLRGRRLWRRHVDLDRNRLPRIQIDVPEHAGEWLMSLLVADADRLPSLMTMPNRNEHEEQRLKSVLVADLDHLPSVMVDAYRRVCTELKTIPKDELVARMEKCVFKTSWHLSHRCVSNFVVAHIAMRRGAAPVRLHGYCATDTGWVLEECVSVPCLHRSCTDEFSNGHHMRDFYLFKTDDSEFVLCELFDSTVDMTR